MRSTLLLVTLLAAPVLVASPASAIGPFDAIAFADATLAWGECVLEAGTDNLALVCGKPVLP